MLSSCSEPVQGGPSSPDASSLSFLGVGSPRPRGWGLISLGPSLPGPREASSPASSPVFPLCIHIPCSFQDTSWTSSRAHPMALFKHNRLLKDPYLQMQSPF